MKHFQNKIHRPAGFLGASDRWRNRPSRPRRQHDKPCRWEVVIGEASSWWLGEASSISDLSSDLSYDSRRLKKIKKVEPVLMIEIDWILYFLSWLVPFFRSGIQLLLAKSVWKWWTPVPPGLHHRPTLRWRRSASKLKRLRLGDVCYATGGGWEP